MVNRLVIVNSFPYFRKRIKIKVAAALACVLPFSLTSIARRFSNLLGLLADGVDPEDRGRVYKALATVRKESYAQRLRLIADVDLRPHLEKITAPVLFIAAEKDLLIPSAQEAREMASRMSDATVRIIAGAGHACLFNRSVSLCRVLGEWVGAHQSNSDH
jgi:pimeloyl-ACP methyl ester carboxylesterase